MLLSDLVIIIYNYGWPSSSVTIYLSTVNCALPLGSVLLYKEKPNSRLVKPRSTYGSSGFWDILRCLLFFLDFDIFPSIWNYKYENFEDKYWQYKYFYSKRLFSYCLCLFIYLIVFLHISKKNSMPVIKPLMKLYQLKASNCDFTVWLWPGNT
jgi:hypothetical protein